MSRLQLLSEVVEEFGTITDTVTSEVLDVRRAERFSVQATIDVNTPSAKTFDSLAAATLVNQSLTYTADTAGAAGNSITIEYIDPMANNEPLAVAVVGTAISVTLATDGSSVITSTGDDVKAAVNADVSATALVTVSGSNASPVTALSATPLAGGRDSEVEEDGADTVRIPSHGFTTGLKGQLTTTGGLPTGLNTGTDYFVIASAAGYIKFANSLANAQAGTAVTITGEGTGVHTFTPTSLAGGAITLRKSNKAAVREPDYVYSAADFSDVAAGTAITADATVWFEVSEPAYASAIIVATLTAGSYDLTLRELVKGF